MPFGKVANCLLIIFIAMANGMPQNEAKVDEKSGAPPFLQFTNGGIRLNFGGYHAEAGLGGLLRGAGTGGGLHASVGTPWGAHAGAGLGGQLDGEDGSLGGGLYARAGLGHGRPDAAAGLGGKIDSRSFNPISGGMYAGATPGGGPGTGVYLGGGLADGGIDGVMGGSAADETVTKPPDTSGAGGAGATATADAAASGTKPPKGRTNIQIIRSRPKDVLKEKEKVVIEAAAPPADAPADGKVESPNKEIRREIQYAAAPPAIGLAGSLYVGAAPVVKSVGKTVAVAAAPAQGAVKANVTANTVVPSDNKPNTIAPRNVYPRWYFRKRFWAVPRKTVYVAPVDSQSAPSDIVGGLFANAVGDGGVVAASKTYTSGSLFDDIFNIPISTLTAVNQLLKNNVG